ncbi:MAG TPA: iron ABC transporter permease [Gemmatimonadetes bacterium]|jgi:iron complex transport system permease protein|nr:iron ABC transporter permease [Gemmatimonadota bacterium]
MRPVICGFILFVCLVIAASLSIWIGPVDFTSTQILEALKGEGGAEALYIIRHIRGPRTVLAILVGGGLALSGAVFQALLRNPLADPYILGISSGAATGAVLVLSLGLAVAQPWILPAAAFAGSLIAISIVLAVASTRSQRLDMRVLLLAGVVTGAFFSACISLILTLSNTPNIRSAVVWMMGSLAGTEWSTAIVVATYTLPCTIILIGLAKPLNLLAIGEETASYLGAKVEQVKLAAYIVASLMTAAGVAATGIIGFVGLIVPHGMRLLVGNDYRILLPLCFLSGGSFLTLADTISRILISPVEIPVGVVTALFGVPAFLWLLRRNMRTRLP